MRSIERKCNKVTSKNPGLGLFPALCKAVKNQNFSRKAIVKAFKDLVPGEDRSLLISHLESITKTPVEVEISSKNQLRSA